MDLLILLAYPILFVHGKLRQFSKSEEGIKLANLLLTGSITEEGKITKLQIPTGRSHT